MNIACQMIKGVVSKEPVVLHQRESEIQKLDLIN